MCNLYSITKGPQAIRDFARARRDTTGNLPPLPGVFPDYSAPIVRNAPDCARELTMARWGMPSPQFALKGRNSDPGVTNERNVASPHWRRWLGVESRCVVRFILPDGSRPPVWFAIDESAHSPSSSGERLQRATCGRSRRAWRTRRIRPLAAFPGTGEVPTSRRGVGGRSLRRAPLPRAPQPHEGGSREAHDQHGPS